MGFIKDRFDSLTGKSQAEDMRETSSQAGALAAQSEQEKLDYLKEVNKLPQQLREQALQQLGGAYGLQGYGDVDLTQQAMNNPLYKAQVGNINDMTQRAIDTSMATSAATGGLRGGNLQRGFGDIAERQQLATNQALANAYGQQLGGLQGLAGLNTGQNQIAQSIGNVGNVQAQALMGGAQSAQSAQDAARKNLIGLASAGAGFSDRRLKTNIKKIGEQNGFNLYSWDWNEEAKELGLTGSDEGHIADEVKKKRPDAVELDTESGYEKINYGAL